MTSLRASHDVIVPRDVVTRGNETLRIKGATQSEAQEVENLIFASAQKGDGFNRDEFCPKNGHFLHTFLQDPKTLVAVDKNGAVRGAAVCGFSTLARTAKSLFGAYFVVKGSDRRQGIGSGLLEAVTELCKKENCGMLLFDVFHNNNVALQFLKKHGFLTTGSLPHSGYVVNNGFTDSLLLCKRLDDVTASDLVAKI